MTRPTKRQVENELEDLTDDDTEEREPVIMKLTSLTDDRGRSLPREESPHPELTVESHPDSDRHDTLSIAIPKVWPNGYPDVGILTVYGCKSIPQTWPNDLENSENAVLACELWDELSNSDLEDEYAVRQERGEPIPPILEPYGEE